MRCAAAALLLLSGLCCAQSYPVKPVRLIAASSPGSAVDIVSRVIAQKLSDQIGQQVVVDNRAGAGGNLGAELAARAPADGYTLFMATPAQAINTGLYRKLDYDLTRDFAPVSLLTVGHYCVAVHPSLPAQGVRELIALAKQRPGQLSYGTSGNGGPQHLAGEQFKHMAGIQMAHIPYRGGAPAIADLLAGQTQLMFGSTFTVIPQNAAGRLRALAVTSARRSSALPSLPTISEAALPGYAVTTWYGLLAPAATPRPLIMRLNADVARALKLPDIIERLARDGSDVVANEPSAFDAHVRSEIENARRIVKISGMRLD